MINSLRRDYEYLLKRFIGGGHERLNLQDRGDTKSMYIYKKWLMNWLKLRMSTNRT